VPLTAAGDVPLFRTVQLYRTIYLTTRETTGAHYTVVQ